MSQVNGTTTHTWLPSGLRGDLSQRIGNATGGVSDTTGTSDSERDAWLEGQRAQRSKDNTQYRSTPYYQEMQHQQDMAKLRNYAEKNNIKW